MFPVTRTSTLLGGCLLLLACMLDSAHAALTISTTRIVYEGPQRSTSVVIANPGKRPYAAQVWVNTAADDSTTAVPFMTAPGLFKLTAGREQSVQISGLPNDLPQDRESLFFFNLQEIPQAVGEQRNALNIALRTRIKLFYRPSQVSGDPVRQLKELQAHRVQVAGVPHLRIHNPTPYHYTFNRLEAVNGKQNHPLANADMLAPLSEQLFALPVTAKQVLVSVINDYGGTSEPLTLPVLDAP
ncbi:molecular chaperone [Pseudomonas sp. S37]|uniref:fimbrial biogenesis chaperone n=1 Tax=Pseudomonas sp. S37 TaxID=2767449 RepID=UPI0019146DEE|nr:molecular chaperone [Pseudomonas sp. S37]MBK4996007.1 molecular chaperone [Pseudomonas sp. S37]